MTEEEHLDNILLLNAALRDLVEEQEWDMDTMLRTIGAWLTEAFNSELLEERTFRRFIHMLMLSYERRPVHAS